MYPALTKRQAEVYHLYKKDYKHQEIADELGISRRTSETLLYQAKKAMQDMEETLNNAGRKKKRQPKPLKEIGLLNKMLITLVDLLEERGVLSHKEWDERVKQELEETKGLKKL